MTPWRLGGTVVTFVRGSNLRACGIVAVMAAVAVAMVGLPLEVSAAASPPPVCISVGASPPTGQVAQSDVPPIVIPGAVYLGATQLQPGHTLAQVFFASCPFNAVAFDQPAYATNGVAGDTLTLYAGTALTGRIIATHAFTKLNDSWWTVLDLPTVQPAGTYTLAASSPVKTIGLWSVSALPPNYELIDGNTVNQNSNFVMGYWPASLSATSTTSSTQTGTTSSTPPSKASQAQRSPTTTSSTSPSQGQAPSTSTTRLPKTGSGPWPFLVGVIALVGGTGLLTRRGRRARPKTAR